MQKIRLDPEALEVHSFATVSGRAIRAGTIRGYQETGMTDILSCAYDSDPLSIGTFCTRGGSCVDGPCRADSRVSQCLC